jgi:hypothetical protein
MLRLLLMSLPFLCQIGCHQESIPVLPPVVRITATLHSVPDLKIPGIQRVEVPASQISSFAKLISPAGLCLQEQEIRLKPDTFYLVADVVLEHQHGSKSNVTVRWTGHNPAAVSLDGKKYYYGGTDAFPDGATRIMRLLREYDYQAQKPPFNSSPITRIMAKLLPIPKQEIAGIESVSVPESDLQKFASLVRPTKPCILNVSPVTHYEVAEVIVEHEDGSTSRLTVRWTGKNPAAVSVDESKHFDGGSDAMTIIRQLQEYHSQAQSPESKRSD